MTGCVHAGLRTSVTLPLSTSLSFETITTDIASAGHLAPGGLPPSIEEGEVTSPDLELTSPDLELRATGGEVHSRSPVPFEGQSMSLCAPRQLRQLRGPEMQYPKNIPVSSLVCKLTTAHTPRWPRCVQIACSDVLYATQSEVICMI